jgi:hypothetical protein
MSDLFTHNPSTPLFIISAGRGKTRLYFHGTGYTYFRNRAKVYTDRKDVEAALRYAATGYYRPALKIEDMKA